MKPTVYSLQPTIGGLRPLVCRPRSTVYGPRSASAFTLIELLVVMVIAVVIMSVSLPSFISMGRGAGMRTAVNNVRSTIALSRQWAITHREQITFITSSTGLVYNMTNTTDKFSLATNDHACYYAINTEGALVQSITELPLDVIFGPPSPPVVTSLTFKTDGGLDAFGTEEKIMLVDRNNPADTDKQRTIIIKVLTGGIKVQ